MAGLPLVSEVKHSLNSVARSRLLATAAFAALLSVPAFAADPAPESTGPAPAEGTAPEAAAETGASESGVEKVVVTATKRPTALQEVPEAITAVDAGFLQSINASSLEDFTSFVPSVDFQFFAPGQTRVTVRGISPDEQTGVSTVSYYIDEIAITSSEQRSQPDSHLYDIDRVEFLRGPQGTLYGEGAMGGTIRIITNKPDTHEYSASVRTSLGFIQNGEAEYSADGMVNIPVIEDTLGLRVVLHDRKDGGWIDWYRADPLTGANLGLAKEDANTADTFAVRAMARLELGENFTLDATYIRNTLDVDSTNLANLGESQIWFAETPRSDDYDLWNATAQYDFDAFSIVSSTSYTKRDSTRRDPEIGPLVGVLESTVVGTTDAKAFTQELRLVSSDTGPFRWTFGGYYRKANTDTTGTRETVPVVPPDGLYNYVNEAEYTNKAIFGEIEYDITDRLTVLGGVRAFWEEEDLTATSSGAFVGPVPVTTFQAREYDDINFKGVVSYDVSDQLMVYASYAEGFRSGGFNGQGLGVPETYQPDKTGNYELGAKYMSEDGRLTVNGAFFYIDWTDLQFIQLDPAISLFFTFIGNANKASSRGGELEITYRPTEESWISISGNYTDAHLDSDAHANLLVPPVIPSGTKLPGVPEYKFSIAGGYDIPLEGGLTLSLSGGVSFTDDSFSKLEQGGSFAIPGLGVFTLGTHLPSYEVGHLRAELSGESWSAALYVNNVWNERAKLGDDNFGFLYGPNFYYNQPRTIGIELSASF